MKKRIIVLAAAAVCLSLMTGGSLAYFTAQKTALNEISMSNLSIRLQQQSRDAHGTWTDTPQNGISGVMPGRDVEQRVFITATGSAECWVRCRCTLRLCAADETELPQTFASDDAEALPAVTVAWNTVDWVAGSDGWMYCLAPLGSGEVSADLFTALQINAGLPNTYQNCGCVLTMEAQAVQTAFNGTSAINAQGWPDATTVRL